MIGGTPTKTVAWPGIAQTEVGGQPWCGATLVASEWTLTAAHCVVGTTIDHVVLGRDVVSEGALAGERIPVSGAFAHEGYDPETYENDIALLRLARPTSAPTTRLATAAEAAAIIASPALATVLGWGNTSENGSPSDVLRQVSFPLVAHAECEGVYARIGAHVSERMLCAGERAGGRDACQGDSGGPLYGYARNAPVQIGIVSWGLGCARPGFPGVYTDVTKYHAWLWVRSGGAVGAAAVPLVGEAATATCADESTWDGCARCCDAASGGGLAVFYDALAACERRGGMAAACASEAQLVCEARAACRAGATCVDRERCAERR